MIENKDIDKQLLSLKIARVCLVSPETFEPYFLTEVYDWCEENICGRYIENCSMMDITKFEHLTGCLKSQIPQDYHPRMFFKDLDAMMLFKLRWL